MTSYSSICSFVFSSFFFSLFSLQTAVGQDSPEYSDNYLNPPESISEEILAPVYRNTSLVELSPDGSYFINLKRTGITPLAKFSKPYYNLGGLQIDRNAKRARSLTTQRASDGIELVNARTGEKTELDIPNGITVSHPQWSPDGHKIAWLGHESNATHIYVSDAESGSTRKITRRPLLATLHTGFQWAADSRTIFTVLVPENQGDEPVRPQTPGELKVRTTSEGENRLRTYQTLLEDRFETELLEYYVTGQLVSINTRNRRVRAIGEPAMIRDIEAAPSGQHIIVQTLQKPFSYVVPVYMFAWNEEIWGLGGEVLATLRTSEINEGIPDEDVVEDEGRKQIQWRPDGEGLSLIQEPYDEKDEEDGSDNSEEKEENAEEEEENVYQVVQWTAPFGEDDKNVIYQTDEEFNSVQYEEEGKILFITQRNGGKEHLFAFYPDQSDTSYTIFNYNTDDFYENPGNLSETKSETGLPAVHISENGRGVFLTGTEYFEDNEEQAPRPFIDRVEIATGKKDRIFQSGEDNYESVVSILDHNADEIVIERESATEYPNFWHVDIASDNRTMLTENQDYNRSVSQAQRERFKVKRADGFEFWVEVVLPENWDGEPLPGLLWHYPSEFDDQEDYYDRQRTYNKNSYPFVGPRTTDILVKEGYAVVLPDWPITGSQGSPNDNFVWSVVQNSTVVIDSTAARGYIDRDKMAIGGHSYGAFGSANAMIHTSFFKAGIAGSGNYNRTLTPTGFQREPSDLWRGMDKYIQMSPLFWADRLDGAFLMYHGEEDQNVGTFPINSERMFHALNSMDKTAVLYQYPHEAHGPAAQETLLDMWRRWVDWLDAHVK